MLSQVVNNSSAEGCWSIYSFVYSVKRNRLNENRAESLVYVHYNLWLLTHYCERAKTDRSYLTWDNNPKEHNLEDGALALKRLEEELLGDDDDHAVATTTISSPSSTLFPDALSLTRGSTSRPPSALVGGGRAGPSLGRGSTSVTTGDDNPIVQTHRAWQKKMEISCGKRKHS